MATTRGNNEGNPDSENPQGAHWYEVFSFLLQPPTLMCVYVKPSVLRLFILNDQKMS